MSAYPTWDNKAEYLAAAQAAMLQVAADVGADTTNVWQSIDTVIAELHKLRSAASREQRARHDAMVARMEAEDAARRARPAQPPSEVVEDARKLTAKGESALARLTVMGASSMRPDEAAAFVESLSGSREGAGAAGSEQRRRHDAAMESSAALLDRLSGSAGRGRAFLDELAAVTANRSGPRERGDR